MIGYSKRINLSGGLLHRMRCDCAQAGQLVRSLPMEMVVRAYNAPCLGMARLSR